MGTSILLAQALFFSILKGAVAGLRDVHISVPPAVRLGQPTVLSCDFELENDLLYTVKWYKSGREFFRYTPREKPSVMIFATKGIEPQNINLDKSNATQVYFMKATYPMSGQYSCEVSADSPTFRTSLVSAHMEIVDPPGDSPVLSGLKPRYRLGDIIHANCTSPGSRPAVNLTWVLNGKSAPRRHVKLYREVSDNDLIVSISTIKLHARETHFPNGRLKLKCTASLHNLYWQTTDKSAELDRQKIDNTIEGSGIITSKQDLLPTELVPSNDHELKSTVPPSNEFPYLGILRNYNSYQRNYCRKHFCRVFINW